MLKSGAGALAISAAIVGAGLCASSATVHAQAAPAQVTFTKDVAPILQKSCQTCHRPGMMAPMSLLTYQDARPWARSIKAEGVEPRDAAVVHRSHVGIQKFKDDPSLTDEEIDDDREVGRTPARRRAIRPTCRSRVDFGELDALAHPSRTSSSRCRSRTS